MAVYYTNHQNYLYIEKYRLFGWDIVISTDRDEELYDESRRHRISVEELKFDIKKTSMASMPDPMIEQKMIFVEKRQRERNWNCIRINGENELEEAIQTHCFNYQMSVRNRISFQQAKRLN